MRISDNNVFFWGSIFSQWNTENNNGKYQFKENGKEFTSCEQYMMYNKAILFNDLEVAEKIMRIRNVKQIKQLGREVKNFDNEIWDKNKFDIVVNGNFLKFNQNPNFKKELYKYKDKEFVEASPVDKIWGIGLHYDDDLVLDRKNWKGQNLLGKAINKVKEMLFDKDLKKDIEENEIVLER